MEVIRSILIGNYNNCDVFFWIFGPTVGPSVRRVEVPGEVHCCPDVDHQVTIDLRADTDG